MIVKNYLITFKIKPHIIYKSIVFLLLDFVKFTKYLVMDYLMQSKSFKIQVFILIITLFFSNYSFPQNNKNSLDSLYIFDPITDDITDKLPPLEALLDSAIQNSPLIKYEHYNIEYQKCDILSSKRSWTQYFGVQADASNGTWWYNDKDELTRLNRFYLTTSKRNQYSAGVFLRFPIFYIIDRKNDINRKKTLLEQATAQKEKQIVEVRKMVIQQYGVLLQQQNLLKISNEYQQYTSLQMKMAENEFKNGEIAIVELTRQKEIQTRGALEYEQYKTNFKTAYLILQEIVGIKFNLIYDLK